MVTAFAMKWVPPSVEYDDNELYLAANSPLRPASSSSSGVTKEHFYKTKLCVFYALQGYCIHGNNCTYAHGVEDLVSANALLASPPLPPCWSRFADSTGGESEVCKAGLSAPRLTESQEGNQSAAGWFDRGQRSHSAETTGAGGAEQRTLELSRSKPSSGRRWTTPQIRGRLAAQDLLIGSRSTLGEESLLSHTSAYPTGNGKKVLQLLLIMPSSLEVDMLHQNSWSKFCSCSTTALGLTSFTYGQILAIVASIVRIRNYLLLDKMRVVF
ncbi:hypothetical protein FOZ60_004924 [Perkinsus olseni]|uniref:C3H1-type domain-containing protein n=1 Tax=Perkinsus olseni TaxID=32597 RepID=A0A7J6NSA4_PEROL|nr:hypothetical protein FOZ60_004924 [Perkinsus olseni]